jgi:sulfopyruvate decarboxylase subunit alpha
MLDGPDVLAALTACGVTHVVWIPDSEVGRWESSLSTASTLALIRVCREGEAIGVAAGLLLGGAAPVVILQCTGLFEAGDALRNVVHDMKLPLFLIVGVRSLKAHARGATVDTCPLFTEPIVQAWKLPYTILEDTDDAQTLSRLYRTARDAGRPFAVLLPE